MTSIETRPGTDRIAENVDRNADRLIAVSHAVHDRPELAFAEYEASALLADEAERSGFTVTRGAYGLPTAFEAVTGSGPFRVVVCAEYDALPGIGHACGHNVIAAAGLGAALALAEVADAYGLTVVLLGTPAEEHGGGKVLLLEAGAWDDAVLSIMVHGSHGDDVSCAATHTQAVDRFDVTYTGRAAHAAAAPHEAINAGDAATVALGAIGLLRQHVDPDVRMHAFVGHGGEATNIIPASTTVRAEVRARDTANLEAVKARMLACFEAGATATGCTWTAERTEPRYAELVQDPFLAARWDDELRTLGRTIAPGSAHRGGSTDMGNVTQVVPGIHPMIALRGATGVPHTVEFAAEARTEAASEAILHAATAMARTVLAAASGDERERYLALAAGRRS